MRRNVPFGIVPALLAVVACSSGTAALEEEPGGVSPETQVHAVTYTIDCSEYSDYCSGHSWTPWFTLRLYDRGPELRHFHGIAQRTTFCDHGQWLLLSVGVERAQFGVGRVTVEISVDGSVVKTRTRSIVPGRVSGLWVWALCEPLPVTRSEA